MIATAKSSSMSVNPAFLLNIFGSFNLSEVSIFAVVIGSLIIVMVNFLSYTRHLTFYLCASIFGQRNPEWVSRKIPKISHGYQRGFSTDSEKFSARATLNKGGFPQMFG